MRCGVRDAAEVCGQHVLQRHSSDDKFTTVWVDRCSRANDACLTTTEQMCSVVSYINTNNPTCHMYICCGVPTKSVPRPERLAGTLVRKLKVRTHDVPACTIGPYACSTKVKVVGSGTSPPPFRTLCSCTTRFTDKPEDKVFASVVSAWFDQSSAFAVVGCDSGVHLDSTLATPNEHLDLPEGCFPKQRGTSEGSYIVLPS